MRKVINIAIFAIGIITLVLTLSFVLGFDQSKDDKFSEVCVLKKSNPQLLDDFKTATPETLPETIAKYQAEADSMNTLLKAEQRQKDILYTYICNLDEQTEETFPAFQQDFAHYSKVLFAQSDNAQKYIDGFAKVADFNGLYKYVQSLKDEYTGVKNVYLTHKNNLKTTNSVLAQANAINDIVSTNKKEAELKSFQDDLSSFTSGSVTLNAMMIFIYIIMFLTIGLLLCFSIWNIASNFKESYKGLLGVVVLVLIVLLGYLIASPELTPSAIKMQQTPQQVKWIGGGIITFYVVFFGAILSIIGTIIMNAVKKAK